MGGAFSMHGSYGYGYRKYGYGSYSYGLRDDQESSARKSLEAASTVTDEE